MKNLIGLVGTICLLCLSEAYRRVPPKLQPPKVCPCQYTYDPVCGSDGVTYTNKCVLDCTSKDNVELGLPEITAVEDCQCSGYCNCQNVELPVCTVDGETYPNECELACENIERIANKELIVNLAYRAACRSTPARCPDFDAPVCGTDNVLYRNKCFLGHVSAYNSRVGLPSLTVKNTGACEDSYSCPITKQPVCGSDGNIYNNLCELEAENERLKCSEVSVPLTVAHQSVCSECRCPEDDEPICASDGNTYSNYCQLECAGRKRNNLDLKPAYEGECRRCKCEDKYRPVCGTDSNTYDNRCLLECENIGRSRDSPSLDVFHVGECQQFACDCSYCDDTYKPICGSDGTTYWNRCWLRCNNKCRQKNGEVSVVFSKKGAC